MGKWRSSPTYATHAHARTRAHTRARTRYKRAHASAPPRARARAEGARTHPQDVVVVRMAAQGGIEERQRAMELLSILKARRGPGAPGTDRLADRAAAELEGLIGAVSARARSDSDALRALRRDCRAQLEMLQAGLARAIRVVGGDGGGRSRGSGADPARTPPRARPGPK